MSARPNSPASTGRPAAVKFVELTRRAPAEQEEASTMNGQRAELRDRRDAGERRAELRAADVDDGREDDRARRR